MFSQDFFVLFSLIELYFFFSILEKNNLLTSDVIHGGSTQPFDIDFMETITLYFYVCP